MKIIKGLFLSVLALGVASCDDDDDNENMETMMSYEAQLGSINDSGASGTATVSVQGDMLTVNVMAQGMVPNEAHPQHIHGLMNGEDATCPPASADTDGDGIITIPEGAPFYGEVLLPLDDFPMADADGNISYEKTFMLGQDGNPTAEDLEDLDDRVIVLHGLNNNDEYVATIPVVCGELDEM
ncbi:CHRD domain-containing protein [Christiangramia sp. SM2212]|uniref:CHRD domain-containing protein n=1 Tax=Christiangramia sediminicola TaxID=3073267 RepID=A0ABU1ERJ8_9FLAO|nr:CHRD domain-containing protein [Christiangramia sp. SM2212]MDR5590991.1 CHRD domain-containing protein [Christiangramia sp. SM2212]